MVRRRKVVFYSANGFESWRRKKSRDTLSLRCCLGAIYHFNNQKLFFFLLNIVLYCQQSLIKLIYFFQPPSGPRQNPVKPGRISCCFFPDFYDSIFAADFVASVYKKHAVDITTKYVWVLNAFFTQYSELVKASKVFIPFDCLITLNYTICFASTCRVSIIFAVIKCNGCYK